MFAISALRLRLYTVQNKIESLLLAQKYLEKQYEDNKMEMPEYSTMYRLNIELEEKRRELVDIETQLQEYTSMQTVQNKEKWELYRRSANTFLFLELPPIFWTAKPYIIDDSFTATSSCIVRPFWKTVLGVL